MSRLLAVPRRALLTAVACLAALAQLVPYGHAHPNPPTTREPPWSSASTRALAQRACFDCHSHQTRWPWYAHVAPASWLVQRDVEQGRAKLNFSTWDLPQPEAEEAAELLRDFQMPPAAYARLHPEARLSAEERRALAEELTALASLR